MNKKIEKEKKRKKNKTLLASTDTLFLRVAECCYIVLGTTSMAHGDTGISKKKKKSLVKERLGVTGTAIAFAR